MVSSTRELSSLQELGGGSAEPRCQRLALNIHHATGSDGIWYVYGTDRLTFQQFEDPPGYGH